MLHLFVNNMYNNEYAASDEAVHSFTKTRFLQRLGISATLRNSNVCIVFDNSLGKAMIV